MFGATTPAGSEGRARARCHYHSQAILLGSCNSGVPLCLLSVVVLQLTVGLPLQQMARDSKSDGVSKMACKQEAGSVRLLDEYRPVSELL